MQAPKLEQPIELKWTGSREDNEQFPMNNRNDKSNGVRTTMVSIVFIIAIGVSNPNSSVTMVSGNQMSPALGPSLTYQGVRSQNLYIKKDFLSSPSENNYLGLFTPNEEYNNILELTPVERVISVLGKLNLDDIIYGGLGTIGIIVGISAAISAYVTPLFDPGTGKVLLPMSIAFNSMIIIRYLVRRFENV